VRFRFLSRSDASRPLALFVHSPHFKADFLLLSSPPLTSMAIHSPQGKLQLAPFHIGTLIIPTASLLPVDSTTEAKTIEPIFLNKKKWKKVKLIGMDKISHDTIIFKFALEAPEQRLGLVRSSFLFTYPLSLVTSLFATTRRTQADLFFCSFVSSQPVGHHVFIRGRPKKGGDLVQRAYTPVSRESETGVLDLLVKLYLPSIGFPEGGKMSQ